MGESGGAFFRAAAEFYRAAPWRILGEAPVGLRLLGREGPVYAVVMGSAELEYGLALYFSAEDLAQILAEEVLVPDALALTFGQERAASPSLRAERKRRRWPLAGPAAFPFAIRTAPPDSYRDPDTEELALLTAALDAVRELCARHGAEINAQRRVEDELRVPGAGQGPVSVRVEWPAMPPGGVAESSRFRELQRLETELGVAPTRESEGGRTPLLPEITERVLELPGAPEALDRLAWSFFRHPEPVHTESEFEEGQAHGRFREWAIFFAAIPPHGQTLAERALAAAKGLTPRGRAERERFIRPRYGFWMVEKVRKGEGLVVRDLVRGGRFQVRERLATYQVQKGWTLLGPLFPVGEDEWVLGTMGVFHEKLSVPWSKLRDLPQETAALELEEGMFGAGLDWVGELRSRAEVRAFWEQLREDMDGEIYTWLHLERTIRKASSPNEVLAAVLERGRWWTPVEMQLCTALVQSAWNVTTRPELGGRSPLQSHTALGAGPLENLLTAKMVKEVLDQLDPAGCSSLEELNTVFGERMRAWLTTRRSDLGGRTPVDAILQERGELGTLESWPGVEGIVARMRLTQG